jgi:hypothetical protein
MFFDDAFVISLKDDPISGAVRACERITEYVEGTGEREWLAKDYAVLLEACALLTGMRDAGLLPLKETAPEFTGDLGEDCSSLIVFIRAVHAELSLSYAKLRFGSLQSHFITTFGAGFAYQFTDGDVDRIQALINELRSLVSESSHFEREHQQRLLRRLEKLQAEMHKKVSDLDRFWGLVGEAGVVAGKLGKDAKPIVDRVREIADIVWRTQVRAEELPSGIPLPQLDAPRDEDE